jgi:hypothetical protein
MCLFQPIYQQMESNYLLRSSGPRNGAPDSL